MNRREVFIIKDKDSKYFGWWIRDDAGYPYGFAETKWGARRMAKRIIKRRNDRKPPIKEFIGEIN
jgi:hypothetical protein